MDNLDLKDPNDSIQETIIKHNKRWEKSKFVGGFIKLTKHRIEEEAADLPSEPSCEFNEDTKTDYYYQRNHRPFTAVKECLISLFLVGCYDYPAVQTGGITLTLGVFLALDVYYQPFKEVKENLDNNIVSTIFVLVSFCMSALAFTQKFISRKVVFYVVGYSSVILVLILLLRKMYTAAVSIYEGIKMVYNKFCAKSKKPTDPSSHAGSNKPEKPGKTQNGLKNSDDTIKLKV